MAKPNILNPLEKDVQKAICLYLKTKGIVYSKTDASRSFSKDGFPRKSKVTPDWPDLTAVIPMYFEDNGQKRTVGVAFFIEVKRLKGSAVREGQKERLTQLRATGAVAIVARCVEDVDVVVKRYLNRSLSTLFSQPLEVFPWESLSKVSHASRPRRAKVSKLDVSAFPDRVQELLQERLEKAKASAKKISSNSLKDQA